jgi:DNA repair photolyase
MANVRGRGTDSNPPNRFEKRSVEADPEASDPEAPLPRTQFLKDSSRTLIAKNESPDIPFDRSINPYRGCEHGCIYCLSGETLILMANGTHRPLSDIRPGDWIYGTRRSGGHRRYVRTQVSAHWVTRKRAFRVSLEDGTQLIASGDHRFLTETGWRFVRPGESGLGPRPFLTQNSKLMGIGQFAPSVPRTKEYERGYLCGLIRGDRHQGTSTYERTGRENGSEFCFRLAMADEEPLSRATEFLESFGVKTSSFFLEATESRKRILAIRTRSADSVSRIEQIVSWRSKPPADWSRGFLAGIFDAEGSYSDGCLRIANTQNEVIFQLEDALRPWGFRAVTEDPGKPNQIRSVRLRGGPPEALRFFHVTQPSIARKRNLEHTAVKSPARLRVVDIEAIERPLELFDITTGTGDFVANGVISHNCYARPYHEYLGFSSGLDFETKILVKEDAPELLREELSSPSWRPQVIAISGVTDAYQPAERNYRLTRRCLEVLRDFRNPVLIITKNHLVTRDADILADLATHRAAAVVVSLTTLDHKLARIMEPRTSTPARRLAAIEALVRAGIPTGVNVAPIIPGLTDSELPAILSAAARAGAAFAGHTIVRLPYAVKELFSKWLEEHFPDRKAKVLHRIRGVRDGRLSDPRFGSRMSGEGAYAEQITALFELSRRKAGIPPGPAAMSAAAFRIPPGPQLTLF